MSEIKIENLKNIHYLLISKLYFPQKCSNKNDTGATVLQIFNTQLNIRQLNSPTSFSI